MLVVEDTYIMSFLAYRYARPFGKTPSARVEKGYDVHNTRVHNFWLVDCDLCLHNGLSSQQFGKSPTTICLLYFLPSIINSGWLAIFKSTTHCDKL